jgi:hypothetical protein
MDDHLDRKELMDIVREAAAVRNGWKRILERSRRVAGVAPTPGRRGGITDDSGG